METSKTQPDLFAVLLEEARRIHAVGDGAADEGEVVEDDGGFVGALEEELLSDVDDDGDSEEGEHGDTNLRAGAHLGQVLGGLAHHFVDETHGGWTVEAAWMSDGQTDRQIQVESREGGRAKEAVEGRGSRAMDKNSLNNSPRRRWTTTNKSRSMGWMGWAVTNFVKRK